MFLIEIYKDGEFLGYSNGNWDYDYDANKIPVIIPDMDFNRLPDYDYECAQEECKRLSEKFIMYDFVINEVD